MLVSNNSFLTLWLRTDCDEKLLNKRHKELLNFISIDEVGTYEDDIPFINYEQSRTEEKIKQAFHNLANQHKRLWDTFFRFQIVDEEDEKCFWDIVGWKYAEWSNRWLKLFNKEKKYRYLKNHIVAEILFFENQKKLKEFSHVNSPKEIAKTLDKLLHSEGFWKEFKEIYNVQNEISIRDDILWDFKDTLPQLIAEGFFDISGELKSPKLYKEFSEKFWISAKELDDNKNVTDSIKKIGDELTNIRSKDLLPELDDIIDWINIIISEIKKLDRLWLGNNTKVINLKDEFARDLRSMGISLYNDHDKSDDAINFIEEAKKIAHSKNLKEKFINDLNELKGISTKEASIKQKLLSPIPLDDLDISISYVKKLVDQGGKFVIYQSCVSFIIMTQKSWSDIYFIPPWVSWFSAAIGPTLITLFLWWWGFPWWPIYSLECIFSNIFWWKDVTKEVMERL